MDNLLKNLKQTQEAQQLISLMGEKGSDEYFKELLNTTGNFDDAVMKLGLDVQTIPLQKQAGITPDYKQLIKVIPKGMAEVRAIKNAPLPQKAALTQQIVQSAVQNQPQTANVGYNQAYSPQIVNQPESFNQIQSRNITQARTPNLGVTSQRFVPSTTQNQFIQPQTQFGNNAPLPPQQISSQIQSVPVQGSPNIVNPLTSNAPQIMTQGFRENPNQYGYGPYGHMGEDYAYQGNVANGVTNPIGGQILENRYDPLYGNTVLIGGANPQEYAQMSPQDKAALTMRENTTRLSHLANSPNLNVGDYVGTGSAQLNMGSTGNSTGPHLDIEYYKNQQLQPFSDFFNKSFTKGKGGIGGGVKGILPIQQTMNTVGQAFQNIVRPVQQITVPLAKQISSTINYASTYKPQSVVAPKPVTVKQPSSQIKYQSTYKPQTVQVPQAYGQQSYGSGQQSSQQSKPNTYISSRGYNKPSSTYTATPTMSTQGFQSYFAPTPVKSYSNPWSSPSQSYAKAPSPVQSQPQNNFFSNMFSNVVNQVKSWASNFGKRSSW